MEGEPLVRLHAKTNVMDSREWADFVLILYLCLASLQWNYKWLEFVEHEMIVLHGIIHF